MAQVFTEITLQEREVWIPPSEEFVQVSKTGPDCGIRSYQVQARWTQLTLTVMARSVGLDHPVFRFEVNGVRLGDWIIQHDSGYWPPAAIPVTLHRPTSLTTSVTEETRIGINYWVDGNTLSLSAYERGTFDLAVKTLASETPGDDSAAVETTETITLTTYTLALPAQAIRDQAECLKADLFHDPTEWRWKIPLEHPEWQIPLDLGEMLKRRDFSKASPSLFLILEAEARGDQRAAQLLKDAAASLETSPEALGQAARDFFSSLEN
ncbi:MAG TPA: hypothetical protein VFD70_26740 [Anaerolineae bacterium]|nr:hypothetical protein [Anaerolineae bacterium]